MRPGHLTATGATETVMTVDGIAPAGSAISPDRRRFLYSQSSRSDDDLMLAENFR
jgi:hypothetical protein